MKTLMEMRLAEWVLWMYANHREKLEKIMSEKCPKCGKEMETSGLGFVFTTNPPTTENTIVCHNCKVSKNVAEISPKSSAIDLSEYKELK